MKAACFLFGLLVTIGILTSCKKSNIDENSGSNITCNAAADGAVTAAVNGTVHQFCAFNAVYYKQGHVLIIDMATSTGIPEIRIFIAVDSVTPLKTYALGPNRGSGIEYIELQEISINSFGYFDYFDDLNNPGIGGSFTLSSLDTLSGRLSGSFSSVNYNKETGIARTLSNGMLNNIAVNISPDIISNGSYISADINGTSWSTRLLSANITGTVSGYPANQTMSVFCAGYFTYGMQFYNNTYYLGPGQDGERELSFGIPLVLSPGTYRLYPRRSPYSAYSLFSPEFVFDYNLRNADSVYYPNASATITVTNVDTLHRNFDATFIAQTMDTLGHMVNFNNGKIHIINWSPFH